jgi:hypothetical protein
MQRLLDRVFGIPTDAELRDASAKLVILVFMLGGWQLLFRLVPAPLLNEKLLLLASNFATTQSTLFETAAVLSIVLTGAVVGILGCVGLVLGKLVSRQIEGGSQLIALRVLQIGLLLAGAAIIIICTLRFRSGGVLGQLYLLVVVGLSLGIAKQLEPVRRLVSRAVPECLRRR